MDDSKKQLERIEIKVNSLADSMHRVDVTLAAQHVSLKEHMRRTKLLEKIMLIVAAALIASYLR